MMKSYIIILSTNENFKLLCSTNIFYVYSTFESCLKILSKIFIVHIIMQNNRYIKLIICLLKNTCTVYDTNKHT